ncbi:MAG: hypothetical protein ACOYB3_16055, partial [Azonexus sp.]
HASHNVAKLAFELSVQLSRQQLQPAYGAGFDGAPLNCGRSTPNTSTSGGQTTPTCAEGKNGV